jgi:hypothetical protein
MPALADIDDSRQNTALFCLCVSYICSAFGAMINNSLNSMKKAMFSVLIDTRYKLIQFNTIFRSGKFPHVRELHVRLTAIAGKLKYSIMKWLLPINFFLNFLY